MSKSISALLLFVAATLAMPVFTSSVQAQAPGVKERSEARRDKESTNVGKARQAEREHQERMKSAKKAADDYKKSNKDAAAKQKYQDAKEKGDW